MPIIRAKVCLLFNISSEISLWYGLLALPLLIYIVWRFYRNDLSLSEMPQPVKRIASTLRIATLILIVLLLLSPFFKWLSVEIKKPLIVVAFDQSQSITIHKDFNRQREQINSFLQNIQPKLNEQYDLRILSFGKDVRKFDSLHFTDKQTNLSEVINYAQSQFEFDNLAAMLILSDGNFNAGQNPLYMPQPITFPIFSTPLGDTTTRKDLYIDKLVYNPHQYTGINIKLQAQIKAFLLAGNKCTIKLFKDKKQIDQKTIQINSQNFFQTVTFTDFAEKPGTYTYQFVVDSLAGEFLYENNKKTAVIHVSSQKQHIAIVSSFPHPDVGSLFTALESNPAFEVALTTPEKALDSIDKWLAMVLYQLPNNQPNSTALLKKIGEKQKSVLLVLGSQTSLASLNSWFTTPLVVQTKAGQFEDAYIHWDNTDNFLNLSQELKETFELFPPLLVPFGEYKIPENSQIIAAQKIKQIKTSKPLIFVTEWQQGNKCLVISGEGFFRWRMAEYLHKQQHTFVTTFFNKMMLYLLSSQKKERFVVQHKPVFNEGENILFEAELYNKIYEPISDAEIQLQIESVERKESYNFYFDKNQPFYTLTIRSLPAGEYKWTAQTRYGSETFKRQGSFIVQPFNAELQDYISNHALLKQLSLRTGGEVIPLDSLNNIDQYLSKHSIIVPISNTEETYTSLINIKWVLLIIVLLISAEWFLRRFFGSL